MIKQPVQTLVHEILYNLVFIFIFYQIYQSNENNILKYSHYIVIISALITHLLRLIKNFNNLLNFTKNNKLNATLEIIKYLIFFYILININQFNIKIITFIFAFIDIIFYKLCYNKKLFESFYSSIDKYILLASLFLLFLNHIYKTKNNYFKLINYVVFYHSLEIILKFFLENKISM